MTVRTINTPSAACAGTLASLTDDITVARTKGSTLLLNMPRDIREIDAAAPKKGFFARLFG